MPLQLNNRVIKSAVRELALRPASNPGVIHSEGAKSSPNWER